jgi:hypothetical protein
MLGDIPKEVIDKINENVPTQQVKWWRRAAIIIVANCCGTLIAGGVLGFFTIIWTKSNATDTNAANLARHEEVSNERYATLLKEIATLHAHHEKIKTHTSPPQPYYNPGAGPSSLYDSEPGGEMPPEEPTAKEVEEAQEMIQQRVDKAIYRRDQLKK